MPLSRLDNFLKNVRGNIIYVDPNSLDATDSITNQGNSMARPFRTIQRALIESSRFSYQVGLDNDRFEKTTIMLSPGLHFLDNRPGLIPDGAGQFLQRNGAVTSDFEQFTVNTNFDVLSPDNELYKLNSVYGGVIIPRGTSIVGADLRKCKIRPLYVPNPTNNDITPSAILRVTGGCYLNSFTVFDGDPDGTVFVDYTDNKFTPNFSHHKLTTFEYADGVNNVDINDAFITNFTSDRTDLDMYYEKVGLAYGPSSGRAINPNYPSPGVDIQPKVDEFRIVGPTGGSSGIASIRAGDGVSATTTVTITLEQPGVPGLNVDTFFEINGVTDQVYNGTFVANKILSTDIDGNTTALEYSTPTVPSDPLPSVTGVSLELSTDTVTGASPYIFNVSMRSIYGMCGMWADGSKAAGFKSMVVAQFTGISLQVDDNAFVVYNPTTGSFDDSTTIPNIHSDPEAQYKPDYSNYHIRASSNSIVQLVSIFAIGYSDHFITESGGDFSVTNSNSNFGQVALKSRGYRDEAFNVDDIGYITNVIPPRFIESKEINLEYDAIDVARTVGVGSTSRLYLFRQNNPDDRPVSKVQGYRVGARENDTLRVVIADGTEPKGYFARIVMPNTEKEADPVSSVKVSAVGRNSGINSISNNTFTLTEDHKFINGESIRVLSDNSRLPDGLECSYLYYAITNGLNADQIQIAQTENDAIFGQAITVNNLGGQLNIQSRVSDKAAGDIGHPVQFDNDVNQWYVNVAAAATENTMYPEIVSLGTTSLGEATPRTFINRLPDNRSSQDRIYQYRFVIPASSGVGTARIPKDGFVLQESGDVVGATDTEVDLMYNPGSVTMSNVGELRNPSYISGAKIEGGLGVFDSEIPHKLSIGSTVQILNVTSSNYPTARSNDGYNGTFRVVGIQSARQFSVDGVATDAGTFTNNTSLRTTSLPAFRRKNFNNDYYVYNVEQVKEYVANQQDGVYYLTILNTSNVPQVSPFDNKERYSFRQPIVNLFPQLDRDNPVSDPKSSVTYALSDSIGKTVISDPKNSISRETLDKLSNEVSVGVGLTDIQSNADGTSVTIFCDRDHGLQTLTKVSIANSGAGYGSGSGGVENLYNASASSGGDGTGANFRITVDGSGGITDVDIMTGGSGYVLTETLGITGTATTTGFSAGSVTVDRVYNNINDTIQIQGVTEDENIQYNQLYKISSVLNDTSFTAIPVDTIVVGINTTGIGSQSTGESTFRLTGPTLDVSSFVYSDVTGLATVTTTEGHGLRVNNSVRIGGATTDFYNKEFLVTDNVGITTFVIDVGLPTQGTAPGIAGTIQAYKTGNSAQGGTVLVGNDENFGGRGVNPYAGITTTISQAVPNSTTDQFNITNLEDFNLQIGDYLRVDNEIVRIKTTVTTNPIRVFRGQLGTRPTSHLSQSVIEKLRAAPNEFRRNSIIRASGHTFEYIGYGPGNYSTALPKKQKKQITTVEQLNTQAQSSGGGIVVYTGMNDSGDFFIGNKRISSNTGKEIVYDTPIQTITGEDFVNGEFSSFGVDVVQSQELIASRGLRVTGGPSNNILSEFDGPVVFNERLTSTSLEGIEVNSIFIQGDAVVSRKHTVGIATPTDAGNPGDVVYNANPTRSSTLGWVYTVENRWYEFGGITNEDGVFVFERLGVGTDSPGECTLKVGSGSSMFCVDGEGVGIGTTANGVKLRVEGTVVATAFTGDGSGLTGLNNDSLFVDVGSGLGTGIHPRDNKNVGIGTTVFDDTYTLTVGSPGVGLTDLFVQNQSLFISTAGFSTDVNVSGKLTTQDIDVKGGNIQVGVITALSAIRVGASNTIFSAVVGEGVGIGTTRPEENLDVQSRARLKSYYEVNQAVTSSANVITLNIEEGQSFTHTTTEDVNSFTLVNPPTGGTFAFTIKILQGATPRTVGIDTFVDNVGSSIPVFWPGGVSPTVTPNAGASDIYSFMSFDGGNSLYGGVVGQNFT